MQHNSKPRQGLGLDKR